MTTECPCCGVWYSYVSSICKPCIEQGCNINSAVAFEFDSDTEDLPDDD